jgi:hypothetical protein
VFSIYRSPAAVSSLSETWAYADDDFRLAILRATHLIDQRLRHDPQRRGESRGQGTRILFQGPLGVLYEVDEEKKLVRILRTWAFRPARSA